MSFLQPILLAALPLIGLPIVIHLISRRRHQTMRWAAMMFLLAANRMSRGYARLRQWLILLCRMLAIAGLVFAVSRPLASGWLGLAAAGHPDTTLILLDRSPSMQQLAPGSATSKFETAVQQLVGTLSTLGSSRWVLIDSVSRKPSELESPADLLSTPSASAASAAADLPAMLQSAHDYIEANRSGRTEIWICSDLRANDWNAQSGRWQSLRDAFLKFQQSVRIHLLAYPQAPAGNRSIRVTDVRRNSTSDGVDLLVSLRLSRSGGNDQQVTVPVQFEIDGARSEITIEMAGPQYELKDHRIPLAENRKRGWGRVSIPADLNPADNEFYFVYDEPPPRQTIIVSQDPLAARPLQLAAEIAPDPTIGCKTEVVASNRLASVEWEKVALVLWQARLPQGNVAAILRSFVARGGQVVFFPPADPDDSEFYGVRWQSWTSVPGEVAVDTWRGDQDLLAHTQSGAALPVGEVHIRRYCALSGDLTPLATLHDGATLIGRVSASPGGVCFCATTPATGDSSLAVDGVVLYVAVQRALAAGAAALGNSHQLAAGELSADAGTSWKRLAGAKHTLSTEYTFHAGVYAIGDQTFAVNRDAAEDQARVVKDAEVVELFRGLAFDRVDGEAGGTQSLTDEVWRLFLGAMMIAMVVEAGLCLPRPARSGGGSS